MMLGVVVLAGCAPMPTEAPTSSPTAVAPTPTATPTPAPLAVVALGGDEIVFRDAEGGELTRVGLDDAAAVTATLTDALGDPEVHERTAEEIESGCRATVFSWGPGAVSVHVWPDDSLVVTFESAEFEGVVLESNTGLRVGEDASDVIETLPEEQLDRDGVTFSYDPVSETEDGQLLGGVANHDGHGEIRSLVSPFIAVATEYC
jgi:hypothetical protein